jgi:polyphenol oxidase
MFTALLQGWQCQLPSVEDRSYLTVSHPKMAVKIAFTTRNGGHSSKQYHSLNLAKHVGDDNSAVERNRSVIKVDLNLSEVIYLNQTHSTRIKLDRDPSLEADGIVTEQFDLAATVLTADCVPVMICDKNFNKVAAIHAGWRGLLDGIIESSFANFNEGSFYLIGPHITQPFFEVGAEVFQSFVEKYKESAQYFKPHGERFLFNMKGLINHIAERNSMRPIADLNACTYALTERFFSFRRDGVCGRQASAIWRCSQIAKPN